MPSVAAHGKVEISSAFSSVTFLFQNHDSRHHLACPGDEEDSLAPGDLAKILDKRQNLSFTCSI